MSRTSIRTTLPSHHTFKFLVFLLLFAISATSVSDSEHVQFNEFTFSGKSLDISAETTNARATYWHPDGYTFFITGRDTENVAGYTLSEAWDISTATFSSEFDLSNEFGSTSQLSRAHGLYFREDGEKMWVFNRTEIWGYTLGQSWDITSAKRTYYTDLSEFVLRGHDFDFKPDGTRLFIDDRDAQAVHQAHLSTPWDITTLEWEYTLDISDLEDEVRGLEIVAGGTIMLLMDTGRKEILQYRLAEPYDLKTARYISAFDVSAQTSDPRGLSIHPDLHIIYVTGRDEQKIYQYTRNPVN
jgi:hypothetical protein